ncbi:MAG TPA: hypothetical protein VKU80_00700 [Planctomycetota bacterium]|nr:hypothetical protein [Planctomycetota bacterium]
MLELLVALLIPGAFAADPVADGDERAEEGFPSLSFPDRELRPAERPAPSDSDAPVFLPSRMEVPSPGPLAQGPGPELTLRLSPVFRWFTGHAVVRENQLQGTRLDLGRDLGLRTGAGADVQADVEGESLDFQTEVEEIFGWGGHASSRDFAWNGTVYSGPSRVRTHASLLTVRSTLALKFSDDEDWLRPLLGVEYPYYNLATGTNRQKGSLEDWIHYLPYPVLGLAGRTMLTDSASAGFRLVGGYLPNVPSPYTEGGRLYVSSRPSLSFELPLAWTLGSSAELSFAFTYQYWSGGDHSVEDGNKWVLSSPGLRLGIALRW